MWQFYILDCSVKLRKIYLQGADQFKCRKSKYKYFSQPSMCDTAISSASELKIQSNYSFNTVHQFSQTEVLTNSNNLIKLHTNLKIYSVWKLLLKHLLWVIKTCLIERTTESYGSSFDTKKTITTLPWITNRYMTEYKIST